MKGTAENKFEVRVYVPADASDVVSVILPIQQEEFGIPITLEAQSDLLDISGFYQHGRGNFWVASAGVEIIGTIALLDIGHGQVALRKMFVKLAFRGGEKRIAHRLLSAAVAWSLAHDVSEIFLGTTAKFLAAHRFYEKSGFTEIEQCALPKSFPVMTVDTRFYTRRIAPGRSSPGT